MNRRCVILFAAAALLFAIPAVMRAENMSGYVYTLTPITAPAGGSTRAWAVNEKGMVVGEAETGDGVVKAFVWTKDTGMQVIGTLGGLNSRALDVDALGRVVGESDTTNGIVQAFTWTEAKGMHPLPVPTGTLYSTAFAVNDRGQVVGSIEYADGMHACLWQESGMTLLPQFPGAGHVQALDINREGLVVGQIQTGAEEDFAGHAFYFPHAVTASNLVHFRLVTASGGSAAVAVNENNTAVGYTMLDSSRVRAFRFQEDSGYKLLEDHDAQYSSSRDVNERGDIVGSCIPSYWSDELACAWFGGRWFDLNEITDTAGDWWLVEATGINQRRDIVGYGLRGDGHQAFLLALVPGQDPANWPSCVLDVKDTTGKDRRDRSFILSVKPGPDLKVRRVLFYENGTMLGSVDEPPYEWGWQGKTDTDVEFYAEILEKSGRRIRSPRRAISSSDTTK